MLWWEPLSSVVHWKVSGRNYPHPRHLVLEPGEAVCFLGGRKSLPIAFSNRDDLRISTADGSGLAFAAKDKITFSHGQRVVDFFTDSFTTRGQVDRTPGQRGLDLQHSVDLSRLRRRSLTLLCVYNSNLNGEQRPDETCNYDDKLIPNSATLQDLYPKLRMMFESRFEKRRQEKLDVYNGLVKDLLLDD
jgi:hypothetical protein